MDSARVRESSLSIASMFRCGPIREPRAPREQNWDGCDRTPPPPRARHKSLATLQDYVSGQRRYPRTDSDVLLEVNGRTPQRDIADRQPISEAANGPLPIFTAEKMVSIRRRVPVPPRSTWGGGSGWNPQGSERTSWSMTTMRRQSGNYRIPFTPLPRNPVKTRVLSQRLAKAAEESKMAIIPEKNRLFGVSSGWFVVPGVGGSSPLTHPFSKYRRTWKLRFLPTLGFFGSFILSAPRAWRSGRGHAERA